MAGVSGRHSWVAGAAVSQDRYRNEQFADVDFTFTAPACSSRMTCESATP